MIQEHEHNWSPSYPYLSQLINRFGLRLGVELGVAAGRHSDYILCNTEVETLWSIDRWKHVEGYDDPMNLPQNEHDELHEFVLQKLGIYGERSKVIRSDTTEASLLFQDKSLDFVYVDADHSYEGCKKDLVAWTPKIRAGGFLTGHDFNYAEIRKAIEDVSSTFNLARPEVLGDSCWAIQIQ